MRAINFARDTHPELKPGEVMEEVSMTTPPTRLGDWSGGLAAAVDAGRPRSWEELDCPDEITVESNGGRALDWLAGAGLSVDAAWEFPVDDNRNHAVITRQAEDCWYAGIVRGYELVLRRL